MSIINDEYICTIPIALTPDNDDLMSVAEEVNTYFRVNSFLGWVCFLNLNDKKEKLD